MKQLLLATALIALPVAVFTLGYRQLATAAPTAQMADLGDMSAFRLITTDVQKIAAGGDLAAAATRITDLETAWDEAEASLRPVNPTAWGNVDQAIDEALDALRASVPDAAKVNDSLAMVQTELDNPAQVPGGAVKQATTGNVAGISIVDANGRALPCEDMLGKLTTALATAKLGDADQSIVDGLQAKALERCNADDDQRSDEFSAQALALIAQ